MSRRSRPPLAFALALGALLGAQAALPTAATAQVPDSNLPIRPSIDADPTSPNRPRQQPEMILTLPDQPRIGTVPNYGYQAGLGAAGTGFDSTNRRTQKSKGKAKSKSKSPPQSSGLTLGTTTAATTTSPPGSEVPPPPGGTAGPPLPPPSLAGAIPANAVPPSAAVARAPQYLERRGGPNYVGTTGVPVDPDDPLALPPPAPTPTRRLPADPAPFDPVGISAGAFTLRPALELSGGFDSNAARTSTKTPSWFETVAPELLANSNWERHSLTATLRGSYTTFNDAHELDRPAFDGRINGIIDVSKDSRINLESRYLVATDYPGSPNVQAGLAKFPINTTVGGTIGFEQRFNRLELAIKGLADRTVYQDSRFTDGTTESNDDRNFNRYAVETRLAYELTPGLKPFMEFGADTRQHDIAIDRNGLMRDSEGLFGRAGSTFEFSRILTGDVAVGWLTRSYKDPTLRDLSGLTVDGSLTWLVNALTTVKLLAKTTAGESTVAGTAGVLSREAGVEVDHAFRQWLIGTLRFTYDRDDYVGSTRLDNRYTAAAAMTYKLTRELQLKGEYRREWMHSTVAGVDYLSNVWLLGVRLQK